jgi:diadenylate cyclase
LIILSLIAVTTQQLGLDVINWVLSSLFPISVVALLIIFQPELRMGLAKLGQFGKHHADAQIIEEIARAASELSSKRSGALIAIEREVGLKNYIESGVAIDGKVTQELLCTIFSVRAILHDGAVIIQQDKLAAAGCILPLSQEAGLSKSLGTRHRAAIGLSEDTDAICVVVSEETGAISMSVSGKLTRDLSEENLVKILKGMLNKPAKKRSFFSITHLIPRPGRSRG